MAWKTIMSGAKKLGSIDTRSNGDQILLGKNGERLGFYQKSSDTTLDAHGKPISWRGQGNQILRLLPRT